MILVLILITGIEYFAPNILVSFKAEAIFMRNTKYKNFKTTVAEHKLTLTLIQPLTSLKFLKLTM